jgi:hypothetical protein
VPSQLTSSSPAIDFGRLGRDELTIADLAEELSHTDQFRKIMVQAMVARDA